MTGQSEWSIQSAFISTTSLVPVEHRTDTECCDPAVENPLSGAAFKTPALLELNKISHELLSIRQQVDKHLKTEESPDEWMLLGQVIDRLFFCLYIMFLSVSFITILAFWLYWYNKNASLIWINQIKLYRNECWWVQYMTTEPIR